MKIIAAPSGPWHSWAMVLSPHITAVLGATNTGKTHYAVERMLARSSGVIGLPLRLLAREVYDKMVAQKGAPACALITGEEKIVPPYASYVVCTVEAMPMTDIRAGKFACVVIDEVQMVAHKERGHIFTDRMLHARGTEETLLLGADTVRPLIEALVPKARFVTRERFSVLSYAGHLKLSRLPKRSVIVAFSAAEVYALAEIIRRHYGGAALVMGGLSPRTRNAQAELYQSGEVDYLVATDAIGMGLNLDADHVAFASLRKFDGQRRRYLYASEMAQIAGRAGRFRRDGSFGTTGQCLPIDDDVIGRIENHHFEPLQYAEWRNTRLDFSTLENLQDSLALAPAKPGLRRIAPAPDEVALARLLRVHDVSSHIKTGKDVSLFWDVCQIPDFRNLGPEAHARLLEEIFLALIQNNNTLPNAYFERNINRLDYIEGSAEILASRLACIRTWTYISNKHAWMARSQDWINRTRCVEDRLSDALHSKLVARFVDRRTSALLKGIGAKSPMDATITPTGEVLTEGHTIGHLKGLLFVPDKTASGLEAKTVLTAAGLALAAEIDRKLTEIAGSGHDAFSLSDTGEIIWSTDPIGKIRTGESLLSPKVEIIGGNLGSPVLCDQAAGRIADYVRTEISQKFEALLSLKTFCEDPGSFQGARALAHVLYENFGIIRRLEHLQLVKETDNIARGYLRNKSAQFGFHHVFLRDMLKPAPARLMSLLFAFAWDKDGGGHKHPFLPPNGMASTPNDNTYTEAALNKAGYTRQGPRIIRFDMLARLAQMILQATHEHQGNESGSGNAPKQFRIAQEMMALLGCGHEDFEGVLKALGYKKTNVELNAKDLETETRALAEFLSTLGNQTGKTAEKPQDATPAPETTSETKPDTESGTQPEAKPETDVKAEDGASQPQSKPVSKLAGKPKPAKSQWGKALNIYRSRPEQAEDGSPVVPSTIDVWQRDFKKRSFKSNKAQSAKSEKLAGYANIGAKGKRGQKPGQKSRQEHKQAPKKSWSAPTSADDSPFGALAALQLSDKDKKGS
ncbi:MAG: hypothetical protein COA69_06065 [Robiginitomaculum sp.]|nr:MAG: hypothetical protein COA69_06065 [Robiginitomaculum sp.]